MIDHCAHCRPGCDADKGIHDDGDAAWLKACPACAAGARIHRAIHEAAARFPLTDWYEAYMHAARIAVEGRCVQ